MEMKSQNQNDVEAAKDQPAESEVKYHSEEKIESWGWTNNVDQAEKNQE